MITAVDYEVLQRALIDVLSNHVHGGECDEVLAELDCELQGKGLLEPLEYANPTDFGTFWDLYDKKIGRGKAEALWERLSKRDRAAIMTYIPAYIAVQPNKCFRRNPVTFLRNRTWEDELIPSTPRHRPNDTILSSPGDTSFDNMESFG